LSVQIDNLERPQGVCGPKKDDLFGVTNFVGTTQANVGLGFLFWEMYMNWVYLAVAGLLEVAWAIGLKYTEGWTRLVPSLITAALLVASLYFLSLAVKTLPIGTAYAVWTGIGTVGAAVLGMVLFDEPRDIVRVACIFLIVAGIAGLKFTASS